MVTPSTNAPGTVARADTSRADAGYAPRRLPGWAVALLAGSAGVVGGAIGFRWWLVVPAVVALVVVVVWARPLAAALGAGIAVVVAGAGALQAPDGRWSRVLIVAGVGLFAAAVAWLGASSAGPSFRVLGGTGTAAALVVVVLLPGPAVPVTGTSDEAATARGLSDQQVDALDDFVRAEMDALRLPGVAVAVVRGDEPVLVRGYGVAGPDRRPVTPDTPFVMASVSKAFTALAVLQLVEAGLVDLDTPVQEYVPWFEVADPDASEQITVRHLLNQTSGFTTPQGWNLIERSRQHTLEEDVRDAADHELHAPPGEEHQYSNVNFQVAAAVIEEVTGETYEQYMEDEVFAPLGMTSTSAGDEDAHASGLAHGYRDWVGIPLPFGTTIIEGAVPMGGISSSAADMANYLIAQLDGGELGGTSVLSAEGITALHEDVVPLDAEAEEPEEFYGLGWFRLVEESDDGTETVTLEHGGTAPQFSAGIRMRPDAGWGTIVLVNRQAALAQPAPPIADGVLDIVTGEDLDPNVGGRGAWNLVVAGMVSVLLVALVIGVSTRLPRWRRRISEARGWRRVLALPWGLALHVALPLAILALPRVPGANWSLLWAYEPGVVVVFVAVALALVALGVVKVGLLVSDARREAVPAAAGS